MPIKSCALPSGGQGWQWGSSKCFPTRAQAQRQAEAAYANGYTGDEILLALDLSARRIDADGQLHVTLTNISKANVCPYYGREIPAPGLEPDRIYQLYRDPKELAAGAHTFNGKQLMMGHIAVSADDPKNERIVGALGTDAVFDDPYLKASISVWDAEAIQQIESQECAQISCGYRYVADMTPGTHNGLRYDGIMRNIVANHVALVPEGRAGPDVAVADGKLGEAFMITSKKALMTKGAVSAYCATLGLDAKPDLNAALAGVTHSNFKAKKASVAARIAKDAKLDADALAGLNIVLDAMEKEDVEGEDEMDDPDAEDEDETDEERKEREKAEAKDKRAKDKKARDKAAKDEEEKAKAEDEEAEQAKKSEKAMDAAIQKAVTKARADTIAEMNAIASAKAEVASIVGDIVVAMDSAEAVYDFALDHLGESKDGLNLAGKQRLIKVLANQSAPSPAFIANDAKLVADTNVMFPQLRRIRQG